MSTSYTLVYDSFLSKITDYSFVNFEIDDLENNLYKYLKYAIVRFKQCDKLNDRDEKNKKFNKTLTEEEIEILSNIMVLAWIEPQINNIELIKQLIGSKNFRLYSQANQLKELRNLKSNVNNDVNFLISSYSYNKLGEQL